MFDNDELFDNEEIEEFLGSDNARLFNLAITSTIYEALNTLKSKNSYNDSVNNYTIDTCYTLDCGWETGISYDKNPWIIVAYYPDEEKAKAGHALWCAICYSNPTQAFSVQTKRYESFIEE